MGRAENGRSSVLSIIAFFIFTRLALTVIGAVSRAVFGTVLEPLRTPHGMWWVYASHRPLVDIWGVADTEWYVDIARHGYSATTILNGQANYAFFPLYPLLMRVLGGGPGGDPFMAGVVISLAALAVACFVLYRLVRLDADDDTGVRSAKYLLLFPTSFVLSGVLSESLYLALLLGCLYAARRGLWAAAGGLAFLLSLTRAAGVLVVLPLLYEYYLAVRAGSGARRRDALYLPAAPCGALLFAAYQYRLTGDPLAYLHVEATWSKPFNFVHASPAALNSAIAADHIARWVFVAAFVLGAFVYLALSWREVRFSYWLVGMYTVLPSIVGYDSGSVLFWSAPRFLAEAFPIYILLAKTSVRSVRADQMLAPALAVVQGFLMVVWTNGGLLPL